MRAASSLAIVVILGAAPSAAQVPHPESVQGRMLAAAQAGGGVVTRPRWAAQPSPAIVMMAFPPAAEGKTRTGRAVLTCTVDAPGASRHAPSSRRRRRASASATPRSR